MGMQPITIPGNIANVQLLGKPLPGKPARVLREILEAAGLTSARVSDVTRTIEGQAQAIIQYYKANTPEAAKTLYGNGSGGAAIKIYEKNTEKPDIKGMVESIKEAIASDIRRNGRQTSLRHTSDDYFTFDVAPSSIKDKSAFIKAVQENKEVVRFLHPGSTPKDAAYHIEVQKVN